MLGDVGLRSGSRAKLCLVSAIAGCLGLSLLAVGWAVQVAAQGMALPGKLEVTPTGAATYTIPIAVPPGTAGMAPSLSIAYSSQGGNGVLGVGWHLEGLPSIGRCPRTIAQDGVRGSVNYDADDRFCLDGQRLVAISGTYGADGTEYRTEIESFSKVISHGTAGTGPAWFEVWTRSGQRMEFGNTTDSRVLAQGKTTARAWVVNKVSDTVGNYFTITYVNDTTNGQVYPDRVDYTGNVGAGLTPYNSLRFVYDTARPDVVPAYHLGSLQKTTVRLTNVQTYAGSTLVADYQLAYEQSPITSRSRLISVTLCNGSGACLPATTFAWQSGTVSPTITTNVAGQDGTLLGLRPYVADFNGDGRADIMWNEDARCHLGELVTDGTRALWTATGSGSFAVTDNFAGQSGTIPNYRPHVNDLNRDGRSDVLWFRVACNGTTMGPTTKWLSTSAGTLSISAGPNIDDAYSLYNAQLADFSGDARHDLVFIDFPTKAPRSVRIYITKADGTLSKTTLDACAAYGNPDWDGCELDPANADINGDGLTDLLWITGASVSGKQVRLMQSKGDGTFVILPEALDNGLHNFAPYFLDINSDGNVDIIWDQVDSSGRSQGERRLWLGKGDGTFVNQANLGGQDGTLSGYLPYPMDLNGDGIADILWVQTNSDGLTTGPVTMWLGKGDGTFMVIAGQNDPPLGYVPVVADFNGDGKADILWDKRVQGNDTTTEGQRVLWLSDGVAPDLVTSVTTGIGASASIMYKPLTDGSVYTKDNTATDPFIDVQGATFVVSRVEKSNGVGGTASTDYAYAGAKSHLDGRGFLGFRQMTVKDLQTNIIQTTTYRQDFPYIGLVANETTVKLGGVTLSSKAHTYGVTPLGGTRHQVFLTESVETSADLDGTALPTVTSTYQYDTYGNVTQIMVSTDDGHSKTTTNIYDNDTTKWILGRLTRATVASVAPGEGGGGPDPDPDTTPDAFSFTDQTDVTLNTLTTSNTVTITGIDAATAVSVSGDGAPQIRINGGSWATSGTITNGQALQVRLTSANANSVTRSAVVTVGGTSTTWSVTTTSCSGNRVAEGCLFSIVGDHTYTVPAGVTSIRVTVVGAGGGYGMRDHSSWHAYGGAGGGSATKTLAVTAGQSFNLTVGPGGDSAPASWCNCSGSHGGASSFGSILSATGGQGGYRNGASQPAPGGTGSGGDQNCNGGNGTQGTYVGAIGMPGECSGGAGGSAGAGGGASPIGGDGRSGVCGAGAGKGDSRSKGADGCVLIEANPPPPDTTPLAFSFTDPTGVPLNTLTTSNTITITGIDAATPVSVSGEGSPQIRINGGSWATSGTITNGQTLQVQLTSANAKNTVRSASVTVGGVTDSWSVTTGSCGTGAVSVGGYCWYASSAGASCDAACTTHGGCNLTGTRDYAGSGGSGANCQAVLNGLGLGSGSVSENSASGIGCGLTVFISLRVRDTSTTSCSATGPYVRACACNN